MFYQEPLTKDILQEIQQQVSVRMQEMQAELEVAFLEQDQQLSITFKTIKPLHHLNP